MTTSTGAIFIEAETTDHHRVSFNLYATDALTQSGRYKMTIAHWGRSGTAHSAQSGTFQPDGFEGQGRRVLNTSQLSMREGDDWSVELTLNYADGTSLTEYYDPTSSDIMR